MSTNLLDQNQDKYFYRGTCPQTGHLLSLPRTAEAEAVARNLMRQLPDLAEGKMFGVLLTAEGPVLKACSGQWYQSSGWAPAISPSQPSPVPARLDELKREILELSKHPAWAQLADLRQAWQERMDVLRLQHGCRKQERAYLRASDKGGPHLEWESQQEGLARRRLRAQSKQELAPLEAVVTDLQQRQQKIRLERRQLSAAYQQELHQQLSLCLASGQAWSLASLFPQGAPAGTGDCCAPKLLYQAAKYNLHPQAMAEFWWGPAQGERRAGEFYAACLERCQPLIGPLLSRWQALKIIYQDEELLAVLKPPGVLTVPGRQTWNQDSIWLRLQTGFPSVLPVHRLDMETSGICLFALTSACQKALQSQFAQRKVVKVYEAILTRAPDQTQGLLNLPLGPDPLRSGCYCLDAAGKASQTEFRLISGCRYNFIPRTGRSHQIRVHAASGLRSPIVGDRLYGNTEGRLCLHASRLELQHGGRQLVLESKPDF